MLSIPFGGALKLPGPPERLFAAGCWTLQLAGHTEPLVSPPSRCILEPRSVMLSSPNSERGLGAGFAALFSLSLPSMASS